ncbi:MAG: trypsin-like peptidase domain-containing protein [Pararhodobacter sp.]|nr:trypsin-like peptidase domain-containing protein [Pararhodobacter sp.]
MRATLLALLCLLLTPAAVKAQDSRLQTLSTLDTSRGWQAVGRLNVSDRAFCTATLIAPDRILTAAHCLYDRATGARIDDRQLTFLAGWRTGRAEATRGIRASVIEPGFQFTQGETLDRVASDLALLQLDQPIRLPSLQPFPVAASPAPAGTPVAVVSYARDRSEAPSLQDRCTVLDQRRDGVMVLSCAIDFGASGAPVFTVQNGQAQIVSVLSAMASSSGQIVALGMRLEGRLAALEAALHQTPTGARDSARFLRPDPS